MYFSNYLLPCSLKLNVESWGLILKVFPECEGAGEVQAWDSRRSNPRSH